MRCVLADCAGFGKSAEPKAPYTVADYAADVLSLADGLGAERFALVGHSFGGRVALELAAHHPERVCALALVDAAGLRPRRKPSYYLRVAAHKVLKRLVGSGLRGSSDYRALSPVMKATFVNVVNYDQTQLRSDPAPSPRLLPHGGVLGKRRPRHPAVYGEKIRPRHKKFRALHAGRRALCLPHRSRVFPRPQRLSPRHKVSVNAHIRRRCSFHKRGMCRGRFYHPDPAAQLYPA